MKQFHNIAQGDKDIFLKLFENLKNNENDIICHFQNDYGIQQNALNTGKVFENWDDRFEFFYTKEEGDVWTDYLANDKGWFLISNRLKTLLESVNTDIQFLKVGIKETNNGEDFKHY